MSELKMTACDACGDTQQGEYTSVFTRVTGWMHLSRYPAAHIDVCSWDCLATVVAAELAGDEQLVICTACDEKVPGRLIYEHQRQRHG